jgi:hypothetical protein
MTWAVLVHPDAVVELASQPTREQTAIRNAMEKLKVLGPQLPYPHSSAIQDADRLRELRPRAGNSPCRAFYRQIGTAFVVAAIGPEAQVKPRDFTRAVRAAEDRLGKLEEA